MGGRRAGVLCSELCCAQAEGTTLRNRNPVEAWASRLRVRLPRGQTPHSFCTPPTAQSKDRRSKEINAGDCEEISQRINREQAEGAGGHVHRPFPCLRPACAMGLCAIVPWEQSAGWKKGSAALKAHPSTALCLHLGLQGQPPLLTLTPKDGRASISCFCHPAPLRRPVPPHHVPWPEQQRQGGRRHHLPGGGGVWP